MDWVHSVGLLAVAGVYLWIRFEGVRLVVDSLVNRLRSKKEEDDRVTFGNQKPSQPGVLIDGVPYRDVTKEVKSEKLGG